MRILLIRQYFPPEHGAHRYAYDLARAMTGRGHDVTVLTGLPNYPTGVPYDGFGKYWPDVRHEEGMKIVRVPLLMASDRQPLRRSLGFLTFAASAFPWRLMVPRPDVILTHVPPVTVAPLGMIVARVRRVPLVMVLHDVVPKTHFDIRGIGDTRLARFTQSLFTRLYEGADRIVVTHETQLQELLELGTPAEQVSIFNHTIDVDRFSERSRHPIAVRLPSRKGRVVILYAGTIGLHQNLPSLLRAWGDHRVRSLPVDLVIVGDGQLAPVCRQLASDEGIENVTFVAPVDADSIPALLAQADALLLSITPSCDVFGHKFYEYLASGKPLLANNTRSQAALIREIGNGWSFDSSDPETLAVALREFLETSAEERQRRGRLGQEYARAHFDPAKRFDAWDAMLREVQRGRAA